MNYYILIIEYFRKIQSESPAACINQGENSADISKDVSAALLN
jgi:hypothetical protein